MICAPPTGPASGVEGAGSKSVNFRNSAATGGVPTRPAQSCCSLDNCDQMSFRPPVAEKLPVAMQTLDTYYTLQHITLRAKLCRSHSRLRRVQREQVDNIV